MRILVIDGQGGNIGKLIVKGLTEQRPDLVLTAVGTNSVAKENGLSLSEVLKIIGHELLFRIFILIGACFLRKQAPLFCTFFCRLSPVRFRSCLCIGSSLCKIKDEAFFSSLSVLILFENQENQMRIIFIRHAEPDYENNTLTPKGFREAESLCRRMEEWHVDAFYSSPLERAILTAEPLMEKTGGKVTVLDWMREFHYLVHDPLTGVYHAPWDFYPEYWTAQPSFYDRENWYREPVFQENPLYEDALHRLRKGMDELLLSYGYRRTGGYYTFDGTLPPGAEDKTIVIFGHLGANMEAIGYLLGISPIVLQQTTYTAPSSVSILNTEMRRGNIAMFRAQCIGDVTHLIRDGEPVSASGAFSSIHQN